MTDRHWETYELWHYATCRWNHCDGCGFAYENKGHPSHRAAKRRSDKLVERHGEEAVRGILEAVCDRGEKLMKREKKRARAQR